MATLLELLQQKKQQIQSKNRQKTAKPPVGRSRWRILPRWDGNTEGQFFHDFGQHFVKKVDGSMAAVYVCVDKTYGRPCDVCNAVATAIVQSRDDATKKLVEEARSSQRVLMNALHRDGQNPNKPEILEIAPSVFADIINIISEWGVETLDFAQGRDLIIERTGSGRDTKYSVQVAAKSEAISPDLLKQCVNLDEYVAQENEQSQQRALASIGAVTGLPALAGPTTSAVSALASFNPDEDLPSSFEAALASAEDAVYEAVAAPAPTPVAAVSAPAPAPVAAAAVAAAVAAPVAAPVAATSTDADLDALLASLG